MMNPCCDKRGREGWTADEMPKMLKAVAVMWLIWRRPGATMKISSSSERPGYKLDGIRWPTDYTLASNSVSKIDFGQNLVILNSAIAFGNLEQTPLQTNLVNR